MEFSSDRPAPLRSQLPLRHIIITPARNERQFVTHTLESVVSQTRPPVRWVIVSDGSTDGTDDLVNAYRRQYDWIDLIHMPDHRDRNFAAKVQCFNAGLASLNGTTYDVIGNLDADISFEPDYFEFLLGKFEADPRLGVAGTPFVEGGTHYDYRYTNIEHVSGACQLFRRACFEQIGGYVPIRGGGIDWTAVTTARMMGWRTRTFVEKTCLHHRPMGTGSGSRLAGLFRHGREDYTLGGHPLWEIFRGAYQTTRRPYIVGGLALLAGYSSLFLRRAPRSASPDLIRFHQCEQLARLKNAVLKVIGAQV